MVTHEKLGHLLLAKGRGGENEVPCPTSSVLWRNHLSSHTCFDCLLPALATLPDITIMIPNIMTMTRTERADNYNDMTIMVGPKLYVGNNDKNRDAAGTWCRPS